MSSTNAHQIKNNDQNSLCGLGDKIRRLTAGVSALVAVGFVFAYARARAPAPEIYTETRVLMDTPVAVTAAGADRVTLRSTLNAVGFYRRHGFVERARAAFVSGSAPPLEVVEMERYLVTTR